MNNVRTTSRIAYKELNEDGQASTQAGRILNIVKQWGDNAFGLSLREIVKKSGYEINAVSGRVNDLKKDGKLKTIDKRKCSIVTESLISPVVPVSIFDKENIDKIKLLLNLYGYKKYEFKTKKDGTIVFMIGYYKHISKNDLLRLQVHSNTKIKEHSFYDDDCGYKCWYEII